MVHQAGPELCVSNWILVVQNDYGLWLGSQIGLDTEYSMDGSTTLCPSFLHPQSDHCRANDPARDRSKNVRIRNAASASMILASVVLVIATSNRKSRMIPAIAESAAAN